MELFLIALAPVVFIAFYVWFRDRYEREPLRLVLAAMFAGVVIVIPVLLHGIYDFILMTGIEWLWIVFVGFVIYLYYLGLRRMKISVQSYYRTDYELLNRKFGGMDKD